MTDSTAYFQKEVFLFNGKYYSSFLEKLMLELLVFTVKKDKKEYSRYSFELQSLHFTLIDSIEDMCHAEFDPDYFA